MRGIAANVLRELDVEDGGNVADDSEVTPEHTELREWVVIMVMIVVGKYGVLKYDDDRTDEARDGHDDDIKF